MEMTCLKKDQEKGETFTQMWNVLMQVSRFSWNLSLSAIFTLNISPSCSYSQWIINEIESVAECHLQHKSISLAPFLKGNQFADANH